MKRLLAALMILAVPALAQQTPSPVRIDSQRRTAPTIEAFRGAERNLQLSFWDGTNISAIGGSTPFLAWATNSLATSVVTGQQTVVSGRTNLVNFTWSPTDLNHVPGRFHYEAGLESNGVPVVYRAGTLLINGSPFGTGAAAVTFTTNFYISTFNLIGTFPAANLGTPTNDNLYLNRGGALILNADMDSDTLIKSSVTNSMDLTVKNEVALRISQSGGVKTIAYNPLSDGYDWRWDSLGSEVFMDHDGAGGGGVVHMNMLLDMGGFTITNVGPSSMGFQVKNNPGQVFLGTDPSSNLWLQSKTGGKVLTESNTVVWTQSLLNGTNGIYWTHSGTNYWLLQQ